MQNAINAMNVLSAMITPAVLISACGTLIFSTSTRLSRVVDRVRELSKTIEALSSAEEVDYREERRAEVERQLHMHARRTTHIQHSLTSFYISLSLFVAATVVIGLASFFQALGWLPAALGIAGTLTLFYGCMSLIAETTLALRAVKLEMEFTLALKEKFQAFREQQRTDRIEKR